MAFTLIRYVKNLARGLFLMLLFAEPLLANKFETIGGGVVGSSQVKAEYLQVIAYVVAGVFFIAGILAIALHNKNAHSLNYTMWKPSAVIFFLLSMGALAAAVLMK
jgi:preprotein translocase subunit SecG